MGVFFNWSVFWAITKKNIILKTRSKLDLVSLVLRPIATILPLLLFAEFYEMKGFIEETEKIKEFVLLSFAVSYYFSFVLLGTAFEVNQEIKNGTMINYFIYPVPISKIVKYERVVAVTWKSVEMMIMSVTLCYFFGISFTLKQFLLLFFFLIFTGMIAFKFSVAVLFVTNYFQSSRPVFILNSLILFLSGIYYSVLTLPKGLRYLSYLNPLTYLLDITRSAVMDRKSYFPIYVEFLVLLGMMLLISIMEKCLQNKIKFKE